MTDGQTDRRTDRRDGRQHIAGSASIGLCTPFLEGRTVVKTLEETEVRSTVKCELSDESPLVVSRDRNCFEKGRF